MLKHSLRPASFSLLKMTLGFADGAQLKNTKKLKILIFSHQMGSWNSTARGGYRTGWIR